MGTGACLWKHLVGVGTIKMGASGVIGPLIRWEEVPKYGEWAWERELVYGNI